MKLVDVKGVSLVLIFFKAGVKNSHGKDSYLYTYLLLFVLCFFTVRVHAEKTAQYITIHSKQNNKAQFTYNLPIKCHQSQ